MRYYAIFTLCLLLLSCDNEDEKRSLNVTNIKLEDIGRVPFEYSFNAASKGNETFECAVKTIHISRNDTIKYIDASITNNTITLYIVSSPHDFDCDGDSCRSIHNLSFDLFPLKQKQYKFDIFINNVMLEQPAPNLHLPTVPV